MTATIVLVLVALGASWVLTDWVRRYALAHSVLDIPNQRSAHTTATPRGGGLAIACVTLVGIAGAALAGVVGTEFAAAAVGGGLLIAVVGWIDDRRGLSARTRAAVHFLAAVWGVFWIRGMPTLDVGTAQLPLNAAGSLLAVLGIVWATNLYNFMDGIDGIAAAEAVFVGGVGGALLLGAGEVGLAWAAFLVASASGGFLVWNWAPAAIFMGDVGSGLLGFLFGMLAVASERAGAVPLLVWLLLLGVFAFDGTITLVRRVLRRARWYDAHHSHAYQRAVRAGWRHARVSGMVQGINCVLGLLAWLAVARPSLLMAALATAGAVLAWVYRRVEQLHPMTD